MTCDLIPHNIDTKTPGERYILPLLRANNIRLVQVARAGRLLAATRDPGNHELYRAQSELEISSTFAFQPNKWLSDIAPEILTDSQRARLQLAQIKAAKREAIESAIPKPLLYANGWPVAMPTLVH